MNKILSRIEEAESKRDDVISAKFDDHNFVAEQYNFILDVVDKRDKCKKNFTKMKEDFKEIRTRFGDLATL